MPKVATAAMAAAGRPPVGDRFGGDTDGFPLAYEVMDGITSDKTTLKALLAKIESMYGKVGRVF